MIGCYMDDAVSRSQGESEEVRADGKLLIPQLIAASPRKFSHYVLDPAKANGKDHVFINLLGFRPRSEGDARTLAATYVAQAQTKTLSGDYVSGEEGILGQRISINIQLSDTVVITGWILRPDGTLSLATPFFGFVQQRA